VPADFVDDFFSSRRSQSVNRGVDRSFAEYIKESRRLTGRHGCGCTYWPAKTKSCSMDSGLKRRGIRGRNEVEANAGSVGEVNYSAAHTVPHDDSDPSGAVVCRRKAPEFIGCGGNSHVSMTETTVYRARA
jgi:hypothetical protein